MKRPTFNHFTAIETESFLSLRSSLSFKDQQSSLLPQFPIQSYNSLISHHFLISLIGKEQGGKIFYRKELDSDNFGHFQYKIPLLAGAPSFSKLEFFELKTSPGLELFLGSFTPLKLYEPRKIIICDFDNTLVETRYNTPKEIMRSLMSPIEVFPTIQNSLEILKEYIVKGFYPFILSASPHFYENAMRDWFAKHRIYNITIFLKDYRKVFSLFDRSLTPKDLKLQGLYKLENLFNILLMTEIPSDLILMGDSLESDPLIYTIFSWILLNNDPPRDMWHAIKQLSLFKFNSKQDVSLLEKIYRLDDLMSSYKKNLSRVKTKIKILIKKRKEQSEIIFPSFLESQREHLTFY